MTIKEKNKLLEIIKKLIRAEMLAYEESQELVVMLMDIIMVETSNSIESEFGINYSDEALFRSRMKEIRARFMINNNDLLTKKVDLAGMWNSIAHDIEVIFMNYWKK
jgi:hypothetical protein